MTDTHRLKKPQLSDPIEKLYVATPSDTLDLPNASRMFMATTSADNISYNIRILCVDDTAPITLENLKVGVMYGFRVKRIYTSGTTATKIVVGY